MANPPYNPDSEQTKEKLRIYSRYLERYLAILLRVFDSVNIYDMMAGSAESRGSADLAVNIIKEKRKEFPQKKIALHLNDKDSGNYSLLRDYARNAGDWVHCQNKDVNEAIRENLQKGGADKNLFYLDPFGYTQIEKESITAIVSEKKNECLWFVPVSYIARFVNGAEGEFPFIDRFLAGYGIDIAKYRGAEWHRWGEILKEALQEYYHNKYVGMATLRTGTGKGKANYYALYFIGNHIYGLEKFMEAADGAAKAIQGQLFSPEIYDPKVPELMKYLSTSPTNKELGEYMLKQGWSCRLAQDLLKSLEKNNSILVRVKDGEKRHQGSFYLSSRESVKLYVKASPIEGML